jgi:asparagine synthase (glutamine-hydrolysing)
MRVGLEVRVPFLDHRLAAFAWSLPLKWKIQPGERKILLRQLLSRYLPSPLVNRRKMGFAIPLGEWLRGDLREWAEELLDERRIRRDGFFEARVVRQEWGKWLSGNTSLKPLRFWSLLMFQAWLEHNRRRPQARSSTAA